MSVMYNPSNESLMTRDQLAQLPVPAARGRFHNPVPFGDFANEVVHQLGVHGMQAVNEEYAVQKDGDRFFGMLEIAPIEGELITAKDWTLQVGLRGSHDQSVPRAITLGSRVLVCSNLCFHGDLGVFRTKQTTNVMQRIPAMVYEAISRVPELAHTQELKFERYRDFDMKPRWGDAALVEIHRRGGLTAAQLGRAIDEWDRPSHEEHAEQGYSAWRLFNAATEAAKPSGRDVNMNTVEQRTRVTSSFIDEVVGW